MNKVLSIAGSDCSGGAGIQADLKTIMFHKCYGMTVITALTSQNSLGVTNILETPLSFLTEQLDAIFSDIFPDAIKIGMLTNEKTVELISDYLLNIKAKNIVVDPVMVATSGSKLLSEESISYLKNKLFKIATIITPNIYEAEILSDLNIQTKEDMIEAAKIISQYCKGAVLIKGGHLKNTASDLLYVDNKYYWFDGEIIDNKNTHGTGCTLSSAIASNLANGLSIIDSVQKAKDYITQAITMQLDIGKGRGPLDHTLTNLD
jgi:hydroxymethylpyrimidine/phosphomethylpyrimidine kinase